MRTAHEFLSRIHIIGSQTRERIVSPVECPALVDQGILLCGLSDAAAPYRMVRPRLGWSELIVTLAGRGRVWVPKGWRSLRVGEAYVAPHDAAQAFHGEGGRWRFVWVQFSTRLSGTTPAVVSADGADLSALVTALHHEVLGAGDRAVLSHLAALVARLAERAAR